MINNIFIHLRAKINKVGTYQFSTCENSAIMSSLLNYRTNDKQVIHIVMHHNKHLVIKCIVLNIFKHQVQLTVRWGNRELWKEEIFRSNASVQPELTDSHLGTTRAQDFNVHTHQWIYRIRSFCGKAKWKILVVHVPSVCDLVISLSSPVKPPSRLKWTEVVSKYCLFTRKDRLI